MKHRWCAVGAVSVSIAAVLAGYNVQASSATSKQGDQAPRYGAARRTDQVQLRFVWWGSTERDKRTLKAVQLFKKRHPNITVKTEFAPWEGYWDKLSTQVSGGNAPDVIQMDIGYIREYADRGALLDMSHVGINTKDISPSLLKAGVVDGKLVGIPNAENAMALLYNPAMLAKVGVHIKPGQRFTWSQITDIASRVARHFGKGYYGITDPSGNTDILNYYIRQNGQSEFNSAGTALNFSAKTFVNFLQFGSQLRKVGAAPPEDVSVGITDVTQSPLILGKSAFDFAWDNEFVTFEKLANKPLGMMLLPALPGGREGLFLDPSQYWCISSQSQHPKEAAMLVDFLLNDPAAGAILGAERGIPPSLKVRASIQSSMSPLDQTVFSYENLVAKNSRPIDPAPPKEDAQVLTDYTNEEEAVGYGKKTPQAAASEFIDQVTQLFASGQ